VSPARPWNDRVTENQAEAALPLAGIVVVDLTRALAGPYATLLLAELGARVVKVDSPKGGDDARGFPPFVNGRSTWSPVGGMTRRFAAAPCC